jgi:hypothetical protein
VKNKVLALFAGLFSAFSILSSFSLIREINRLEAEWYVILFLTLFLLVFVVFVEYMKVIEVRRKFNQSVRSNLIMLLFTFTISIGTSGIGIWFWTDQTQQINQRMTEVKISSQNTIEDKYNHQVDSVSNLSVTNTPEYHTLFKVLEYWQDRRAIDSSDLRLIRESISRTEKQMARMYDNFSTLKQSKIDQLRKSQSIRMSGVISTSDNEVKRMNRNNTVTFIFLILILIIEFMIVMVHKELCNPDINRLKSEYWNLKKLIIHLQLRGFDTERIDINEVKYSTFMKEYDFDQVKKFYNLLHNIKVIDVNSGNLTHNCVSQLDNYYKTMIKLV